MFIWRNNILGNMAISETENAKYLKTNKFRTQSWKCVDYHVYFDPESNAFVIKDHFNTIKRFDLTLKKPKQGRI